MSKSGQSVIIIIESFSNRVLTVPASVVDPSARELEESEKL